MFLAREKVFEFAIIRIQISFSKLQLPTMSDSSLLSSEASLSSSDSLDSFSNFDKLKPYRSSSLEVFCKKGVLRNFIKFTGKQLCQSLFFNKIAGLSPATLLKKRLWHRCFPVNVVKFLGALFFVERLWTTASVATPIKVPFWRRQLVQTSKGKNQMIKHNLIVSWYRIYQVH